MRLMLALASGLLLTPRWTLPQTPSATPAAIQGRLTDQTGRAIRGAIVSGLCASQPVSTVSDAQGVFALTCASGLRVAVFEAAGFAPRRIDVSSGLHGPVLLYPSTVTQQVSITAARSSSPLGEIAKTVSTLSAQALHDYPAVTLDEALRQHAGFELFRRAPSRIANPTSEGISLRGLGSTAASRTLVLEDGAPLNDPFGGYIHWNESPEQTIESVTLVSGGGSDLYGSSALGGVIDIVPITPDASRADLSLAGGAQDTSDFQATAAHHGREVSELVAGESLRTAGYRLITPALAGLVDTPANVRSQAYRAEFGRRDHQTKRLFATGNLLNEDRSNGTPLQTNATRLWRYLGGYDLPETRWTAARLRLFGSQEGYRQSFSAIGAGRNSEFLTRLQRVHTQELGATVDTTMHFGSIVGVAGADVRDLRARDNETPISRGVPSGLQAVTARQRYIGGFGELLAQHAAWSGAFSLRADRASNLDIFQTTRAAGRSALTATPDRTEIVLSPRLGLTRTLGARANVHASAFRAFRSPTFNELYRTGQVGQEITLANASLRSERATGWELGTQLSNRSHSADLQTTYFWTEINRPVSAILRSQTSTSITNQRVNLGQIRSRGVEVALALHPTKPVSATFGYQFAAATVTRFSAQPALVGNQIPQVPRHSFTAQLTGRNQRLGELTFATRASSRAFDDSSNNFPLNGFVALDLSGQRSLTHGLNLFFVIENLTGERAQVARTPVLTLGSPSFAEGGIKLHFGQTVQ